MTREEGYPWQVSGLYQGESAGQLLEECSALLKPFSRTPIPPSHPSFYTDEIDGSIKSRNSFSGKVSSNAIPPSRDKIDGSIKTRNSFSGKVSSNANSDAYTTRRSYAAYPTSPSRPNFCSSSSSNSKGEQEKEGTYGFNYMKPSPQYSSLREGTRHTAAPVDNETQSTREPETEGRYCFNYLESNPMVVTSRRVVRYSCVPKNNETQSTIAEQEKQRMYGNDNLESIHPVITWNQPATFRQEIRSTNETQSTIDEEKLLKRSSLLSPRPFTYLLNESALSNRLIAGKSKAEGSSMMKLEQNELETSERREMEIKNGTMRGGTTDVSSRIQSTLSSNSKSAYVTSRLSVRQCFSSKMVTGTLLKNEECSTSTEKRSAVEESLVFSKGLPKKRFSLNSRRNVESSIDRLVRHFDSTLYQNYFFLEEASHSLGQNRMPVHQDACSHKPLAIEMLKNQETHEHNLEVPQSPDLETETNVSKSNSKVLKDLVEPQQTSRKLWSHMPQVKASGYLEKATTAQQHLQEAKFEVITSEASYYRSLVILETHFALRLTNVMTKAQHKFIFGYVKKVRKVSESVLTALSKCFENNILMTNMCHILYDLVKDNFQIYITYCKNQPLIEKTLEEVRKEPQFEKALHHLELEPVCQNLNLPSFLILPMQRFLRMPLLVDSILKKLNTQDIEYKTWEKLLKHLKKKAEECNNACGELDKIAKQYIIIRELANSLQFVKGIPPLALQSSSRSLLLQDTFSILSLTESVATEVGSIRLTLLSDYLILAKPVGSKHYQVITYCKKDKASIKAGEGTCKKRFIVLKLAANYKGESERWFLGFEDVKKCEVISKNWMEALPPSNDDSSDDEHLKIKRDGKKTVRKSTGTSGRGNKLVKVIYEFGAKKHDELELKPGEFISVKSRSEDGWCYGERVRDGKGGWFPENYTSLVSQSEQIEKTLQRELV